ncbi:hypothetical protein NEDG_00386 [Nematocida displodere]|uniref:GRAM domain-containing protein n=1 Tax=Nematocida displodere TaxID=1805483 RepID=A0A177EKC8_9MICR|nr:hypothetical protein NEDG_00386 [Nematocida displodere]
MDRLRFTPRNFNTGLFTEGGTPLPVLDNEQLLYVGEGTEFYMKLGEGNNGLFNTSRYYSNRGTIFITTYRLFYRPDILTTQFCSFFVINSSITTIKETSTRKLTLVMDLEGNIQGRLCLNLRAGLSNTLAKHLERTRTNLREVALG